MKNLKTEKGMRKAATFLNKAVFSNSIELDNIKFKALSFLEAQGMGWIQFDGECDFWGLTLHMEHTDEEIFVCVVDDISKQHFLNILTHELIHVWQIQHNKPCDHGKVFKKWCQIAYNVLYENMDAEAA